MCLRSCRRQSRRARWELCVLELHVRVDGVGHHGQADGCQYDINEAE